MLYQAYEFQRQLAKPVRVWANLIEQAYSSPFNPFADTWFGKSMAAGAEIVSRLTQNYGKPAWGLKTTRIDGEEVAAVGAGRRIRVIGGVHGRRPFRVSMRARILGLEYYGRGRARPPISPRFHPLP